jgi:hypothetical protein
MLKKQKRGVGDEYLYYNFRMVNNSNSSKVAQIYENLAAPLLEDGIDYFVSCIRFVLDGAEIPIFNFIDGAYHVVLSYFDPITSTTHDYDEVVLYDNNDNDFGINAVYSYTAFLEMINAAYALAWTALVGDFPALTGGPPYMVYVPATGLCPIFAPITYVTSGIKIFMNSRLFNFFGNFYRKFYGEGLASFKDYEILVRDLHSTNTNTSNIFIPAGYYMMNQEFNSLYSWFDITGITFLSNTLGIKSEFVPNSNTTNQLSTNNAAGAGSNVSPILTDFQPYYAIGDSAGPRGYLYYTPSSPWRMINVTKDKIISMDLTILLTDRVGNQFPYYIPPNQSVSVKLAFVKRTELYKE